jgi:hypothetical protein
MDEDLKDLLALWLGDHDPGAARRDALLARLHSDDTFRRAFVEEIRLLGMLRAVQSSEPRWLRLEDEVGWSARQREDIETLAQRVVQEGRRRFRARRLARWSVAAAVTAVVAASLFLAFRTRGAVLDVPPERPHARSEVATITKVEDVRWGPGANATLQAGSVVTTGHLRLEQGRLTLAFFSGVSLTVEGPADLDLRSADRVFCHYGKLRARVPRGAEGFTVLAAGYEIVDLGTEFALNLQPGGKSQVMVFEGSAAVSVFGRDGRSIRGEFLERRRSIEVDPNAGRVQEVRPRPETFVRLAEFKPAPLELAAGYAAAVREAKPWGYWRFETLKDDCVPNEVASGPALKAFGGVKLERSPGGNSWARFQSNAFTQALRMDGVWSLPRTDGYAIELWVQADLPSQNAFSQTALVGLIERANDKAQKHLAYLELTARGRRSAHEPCAVRFLDRWPPAVSGGADVFSRRTVVPSLWRHVVAQKSGDTLELYVDGECVGTSPVKRTAPEPADPVSTPCEILVGRLKPLHQHPSEVRPFEGRLDELAVYDRALTPEEIRLHARLRADVVP